MSRERLYDVLKRAQASASEDLFSIYHDFISRETIRRHIPHTALLELSPVCNFDCSMCYIRRSEADLRRSGDRILRFEDWKYYIDGLCDLGILYFTLTGGEATLHPDFLRIYEYLYSLGRHISVMTNGSLLDDRHFDLFRRLPPYMIYITLYGTSAETYGRLCKQPGAYARVTDNIDRLLAQRTPLSLQFTCTTENLDDLESAYHFAKARRLALPFAETLLDFGNCDEEKVRQYSVDEERFRAVSKRVYCDMHGITPEAFEARLAEEQMTLPQKSINEKGMSCNAGRNSCTIKWTGRMTPCNSLEAFSLDPHENGGIAACWQKLSEWADDIPRLVECQTCIFRSRCRGCPALHYNDTGEFGKPSPRICFKRRHPEKAAELEERFYAEHPEERSPV